MNELVRELADALEDEHKAWGSEGIFPDCDICALIAKARAAVQAAGCICPAEVGKLSPKFVQHDEWHEDANTIFLWDCPQHGERELAFAAEQDAGGEVER